MKCSLLVVSFVCLTLCHRVTSQNGYSNDVPQVPFGYNGNGGGGQQQQQFGPDDGYQYGNGQNGDSMIGSIPGRAGEDYPIYATPPDTAFKCDDYEFPGYYADPEAQCQVFHICQTGNRKDSFLCPNGTLFNQEFLVCDWWNHVDCNRAQEYYSVNQFVYQEMQAATQRLLFEQARRAQQALDQGYSYNSPQNGEGYSNGNGNQNGGYSNGNGNQNGGYSNGNGNQNGGYSNGNGSQNGGYSNGNGNQNRGYSNGNGNQISGYSNGNGNQNGGYSTGNGIQNGGNGSGYTSAQSTSYLPPNTNGNRNGNGNGNRNSYSNGNGNRNGYSRGNGNRNNYSNGANSREYLPPQ